MRFSEAVTEITTLWCLWLQHNDIAIDATKSAKERRAAAVAAERLLNRRYELQQIMDSFFDKGSK